MGSRPLGFGSVGPKPKGPRRRGGPTMVRGPLGLGPTGPNPRGLGPSWARLDTSAPWFGPKDHRARLNLT